MCTRQVQGFAKGVLSGSELKGTGRWHMDWGKKGAEGSLSHINLNLPEFDISEPEFSVCWEYSIPLVEEYNAVCM